MLLKAADPVEAVPEDATVATATSPVAATAATAVTATEIGSANDLEASGTASRIWRFLSAPTNGQRPARGSGTRRCEGLLRGRYLTVNSLDQLLAPVPSVVFTR
jgi:hypothetical protein